MRAYVRIFRPQKFLLKCVEDEKLLESSNAASNNVLLHASIASYLKNCNGQEVMKDTYTSYETCFEGSTQKLVKAPLVRIHLCHFPTLSQVPLDNPFNFQNNVRMFNRRHPQCILRFVFGYLSIILFIYNFCNTSSTKVAGLSAHSLISSMIFRLRYKQFK